MIESYGQPQQTHARTYSSARHAATRWLVLVEQERDSNRGFNVGSSYTASFDAGGKAFNWTPLDGDEELDRLRAVFRMAVEDATRERGGVASRWWKAWWVHRIDGVRLCDRPGGYSSGHLTSVVLPTLDEYVEAALDWFDLLDRPDPSPVGEPDMSPNNGSERYAEDAVLIEEIRRGADAESVT